jgi:hypothetical protein
MIRMSNWIKNIGSAYKVEWMLAFVGGIVMLVLLPPSLVTILVTGSVNDKIFSICATPIIIIIAIIAIKGGRHNMRADS